MTAARALVVFIVLAAPGASLASQECTCAPGDISPVAGACVWGTVSTQKPWAPAPDGPRDAKPVSGVDVIIVGPVTSVARTRENGRFDFGGLLFGDYTLDLAIRDPLHVATSRPRQVTIDACRPCAMVDLLSPVGAAITGVVTYEDGAAASGVHVEVISAHGNPRSSFIGLGARTSEQGEYTLGTLPPGHYVVGVGVFGGPSDYQPLALAYARGDDGGTVVAVGDDPDTRAVTPIVTRRLTRARVEGAVQWSDGTPARGLIVTAAALGERGPVRGRVRAQSAADGGFTLDVFGDTQYRVDVSRGERIVHSMDITATGEPLLITLPLR